MGVLVDVDSETFLLPKKNFPAAKRALEALAVEYPRSFEVPKSVAGCEDLQEALSAGFWRFETNTKGDLVMLSYGADKAPDSGSWPVPVLEALAPFVTRATIVYRVEGDDRETVYTLAKGKILERRRKRTKRKAAPAPEPAKPGAWIVAPPDSFGIEWRARLPGENEWYRKRDRVASFLEALAKTKLWRELDEVYFRAALLPIAKKGGALPVADVVKRVADAQWGVRWFASGDRETTLELDISDFELGFRLRVRDGALARVGSAVIDDVAQVVASYARAHRASEPVVAHAAPFGRGYAQDADGPVLRGPEMLAAGELHLRANALATILDGRPRAKDDDDPPEDETTKAMRKLAAAKKVPGKAKRTEEDGVVVVTFPCDPTDRDAVRAAAAAHAKWIAEGADVTGIPSRFPKAKAPVKKARKADDPALADYALSARFELIVDDDPYWFRERSFFEVVYRAFAKTAYWPELAKPGAAAVDKAIAAVKTGRNDTTAVLRRGDEVKLELSPNVNELAIRVSATKPVLTKLGARATRDLVAFLGEVHGALAGRGRIGDANIEVTSEDWDDYVGHDANAYVERWPPQNAVVTILDPLAAEDGTNGRALHIARTLAAAPLPPGAERIESGRVVAVVFADDVSDPVATAEACARGAAWIRSVQAADILGSS